MMIAILSQGIKSDVIGCQRSIDMYEKAYEVKGRSP
jgi:hypothetical protein